MTNPSKGENNMITRQSNHLIYLIDPDNDSRAFTQKMLKKVGYETQEASYARQGLQLLLRHIPSLVIFDFDLPDMDGASFCRQVRGLGDCPMIALSSLADESTKVTAFEAGIDDYITKPFSSAEVMARIKAILRRYSSLKPQVMQVGSLEVDLATQKVRRDGVMLHLSRTEWLLFKMLVKNEGQIVAHDQFLQQVWGPQYSQETHYIHIYMARLRRKLEQDPRNPRLIITEPGMGYRFAYGNHGMAA
jgi:two-component system KDP operon response regulator KdpE